MKIVITGGAGFIGSHITDRMQAEGHELLVVDDLSSGFRENIPASVPLVEDSFASDNALQQISVFQPDVVIHAAAQISVRKSMEDPAFDAEVNVKSILKMLNVLQSQQSIRPHLVFISTGGAMYGDTDQVPTAESAPILPESLYGLHKRFGELYFDFYYRVSGLPYTVLRLGNVYGPRQNPHGEAGVVAIFSEKLLRGEPCTIFGDGLQTRDFVYVGDVVEAVALTTAAAASGNAKIGTYNVGTGEEVTVKHLFELMKETAGSSSELVFAPGRPGEQKRSAIDASAIASAINWNPRESLPSGIKLTIEWFGERGKN
ncbi:MAG: NAD-dependent epimerase/dehydratase family protein [Bdellovibrionales bacterium]|nr:NAD-dependent epimerase/dehydratase family protein [Bdellovibrionales bacterium]